MALVLDGTNNRIEFPDGSTTDETDVLIHSTFHSNNTRQSASFYSSYNYWWEVSFTRQLTNSDIRVTGLIHGQGNHCYPYYGTAVRLVAPNGTTYLSDGGCWYFHTQYGNGSIPMWTEKMWLAAGINSETGTWKVQFGWRDRTGQCKPFNMINWDNNEESHKKH